MGKTKKHVFLRIDTIYGRKSLVVLPGQKREGEEVRDTFGALKRHPEGTVFAASSLVTVRKGRGEYLTARDIFPVNTAGQETNLFQSELKKEYESLTKSA